MKKEIDDVLTHALTPTDEPDCRLNQEILNQAKERNRMEMKRAGRIPAIALLAALVLGAGSVTAYAAWKYLAPEKVTEQINEQKLTDAFSSEDAIIINETQSFGGYDVTLLGIVSGKNLIELHKKSSNGYISTDQTYSVVAIEASDGIPMDDTYTEQSFFVSPLIKGYHPKDYNAASMHGGYTDIIEDGILYRIAECDNVEMFADCGLYLCVSDTTFYSSDAYVFDESTGEISRNEAYTGLNALFHLPIDAAKADPAAAEEYIRSLGINQDGKADDAPDYSYDVPADIAVIREWLKQLTPENIEQYAERLESSVQVLTPDEEGYISYRWEAEGRASGSGTDSVQQLFPDGEPKMSDSMFFSESGFDSIVIQTYTLNEDGTVTHAIYIPKESEIQALKNAVPAFDGNGSHVTELPNEKENKNEKGADAARYALQFVGTPYLWGADSLTEGTDCSGFTKSVYESYGISLPHSSNGQKSMGYEVESIQDAQPGDLIFYSSPAHVAIYIGYGEIVHADPASGVCVSDADYDEIVGIRRIFETE